ncbi:MAG: hypothetical protein M4D80_20130 [Myxococcota bacterium]|nr:hypothetical protein [Deltaproteobacteria bacterium]MDQ3337477.1 hypothetical protein [Myxococcota bacterium]
MSTASPALRRLLETKLDTYEKLELVVVLSKRAGMEAPLEELARELQVGDDVMKRLADELARTGLVEITGEQVRLVGEPGDLATIDEGAALEPRKVISLLSSIALDRIRGMAARSFADAFTLRKKKDNGDG